MKRDVASRILDPSSDFLGSAGMMAVAIWFWLLLLAFQLQPAVWMIVAPIFLG